MVEVVGIQGLSTKVQGKLVIKVKSRVSDFVQTMDMYVLPKISAQISKAPIATNKWNIPKGIELADPMFFKSEQIDLVLGAEYFFEFFPTARRVSLGDHSPLLIGSVFGRIITGKYPINSPIHSAVCNVARSNQLEDMLEMFWECEEVGLDKSYSPDEAKCEEIFVKTTQRDHVGRYTATLPKSELVGKLGDSNQIAERRLIQLERRLNRDASLKREYSAFYEEYAALGHMQLVSVDDGERVYLPHHPVVIESSTTKKVRVMFDASSKKASGLFLKDCLLAGPTIQDDLRFIILRCRTHQVMLVAEIEKMFRQVNVCQDDRRLQSILWRTSPDQSLKIYELTTITYGTKPAPFLATRALVQLALDEAEVYPLASKAVLEDFYLDDTITGADDPDTAKSLRIQLQQMEGWNPWSPHQNSYL
ncbi:uncharacterized protein LOC129779669 [Toxorhynchites rutilus septentrionalis]|uniref:uncharacterized protein LOC129779669 n=1 Tax=Toxorhynchites rutilus septentrionalis TaxID=329112 RepID=UPI002479BCA6|nr:uncharacterized protein LOC129779669 [Toxorhynchites rutilus septentrionalis]